MEALVFDFSAQNNIYSKIPFFFVVVRFMVEVGVMLFQQFRTERLCIGLVFDGINSWYEDSIILCHSYDRS